MADDPDANLDRFERSILHLSSQLGKFTRGSMQLDDYRENPHLSRAERSHMASVKVDNIIPFNHEIKELINDFPRLKMKDLAKNLTIAHSAIYSNYDPNRPEQSRRNHEMSQSEVAYRFESGIEGMRHEIAAETLLSAAGIEYDYRISAEEDSTGNDLFVAIDGHWVGIDIKASFNAERRAYSRHRTSRAVWTTLQPEEFRGPNDNAAGCVSISYGVAQKHALEFESRVYRAARGELAEEYRTMDRHQHRGRAALQAHHAGHSGR